MKQETIEALTHYRQFATEKHRLANSLHIKDKDAEQLLLLELLEHRLSAYTDEDIQQQIALDNATFSFKFSYARKDILRKHYRQLNNQAKATSDMTQLAPISYTISELTASNRTSDDLEEALGLLPTIFVNAKTREWVAYVLKHGKEEALEHFHQSSRAFTQKLNRVCKYAETHRERTIGLLASKNDKRDIKEIEALSNFAELMDNTSTNDDNIQLWIENHLGIVSKLIDTPKILHQGTLIRNFSQASNHDKYTLINLLYKRKEELEHYLILR